MRGTLTGRAARQCGGGVGRTVERAQAQACGAAGTAGRAGFGVRGLARWSPQVHVRRRPQRAATGRNPEAAEDAEAGLIAPAMSAHLKVFAIAAAFGLAAYAAVRLLLYLSDIMGLLDWLR